MRNKNSEHTAFTNPYCANRSLLESILRHDDAQNCFHTACNIPGFGEIDPVLMWLNAFFASPLMI